jgi:hypothetical protein
MYTIIKNLIQIQYNTEHKKSIIIISRNLKLSDFLLEPQRSFSHKTLLRGLLFIEFSMGGGVQSDLPGSGK